MSGEKGAPDPSRPAFSPLLGVRRTPKRLHATPTISGERAEAEEAEEHRVRGATTKTMRASALD